MKLALILLISLVGLSYQQRLYLSYPYTPRLNYLPFFYGQNVPAAYLLDAQDAVKADDPSEVDALARTKPLTAEKRFLFNPFGFGSGFGGGFGAGFGGINPNLVTSTVTTTSTWWTTTSGTATTATLQYCIPNTAFATSNVGGATVYSTGPCARRRREAQLLDQVLESIEPTETKEVETSAVPELVPERQVADEPQLVSSKDDDLQEGGSPLRRRGRAGTIYYTYTYTTISTATSFSFTLTTFKKPITLGTGLLCLPSGLAVC